MADDTLELIEPIFENNSMACPKNMLPYEEGVLLPKQQRAINSMKVPTVRENQQYLASHPEVNAIVTLLLRAVFANRPKNIPEYMGNFMAREEVEEEIKNYLDKEMHTLVGRGAEDCYRKVSKRYHFLDEDQDKETKKKAVDGKKQPDGGGGPKVPDFGRVMQRGGQNNNQGRQQIQNSISEHIHSDEEDGYRMSVISGISEKNPILSTTLFESGTSLEQPVLRTLMSPRTDSSTHTDSLGTCSLLDELDESDMARSVSADRQMVLAEDHNNNDIPFSKGRSDDDVGSSVGDQLNDEIIMRMPKRNLSGLSAISEAGIFKAVGVEELLSEEGEGRQDRRMTPSDSRRESVDSKRTSGENKRPVLEAVRGANPIVEEDENQTE